QKGETLIMVIIVAVILLIIGGAVLVFTSGNLAATHKQGQERQIYFIAKSTTQTITDSLEKGELGDYLKGMIIADLKAKNTAELVESSWDISPVTIALEGEQLSGYTITDVSIKLDSSAQVDKGGAIGAELAKAFVSIKSLDVTFTVGDSVGNVYSLTVNYRFSGWYERTAGKEIWSNCTWKVVDSKN
ncbi:MAG: hypothetical protein RR661_04875, partial [Anaerovoracaceae bacterium]